MKVGIAGAGAVGCHYGSRLQQAGVEVVYLARGEHLRALQEKGLVHISDGIAKHMDVKADDDVSILNGCDVIVLACKATVLEEMCRQIMPAISAGTVLVTMQNGVEAPDEVRRHFADHPIIAASAFIGARIEVPGMVIHSAAGHLRLGWWQGRNEGSEVLLSELLKAWNSTGVDAQQVDDMKAMLWHKMLWNCGFNAVTALTRCFAKDIASDDDSSRWVHSAMNETVAVAEALGVTLPGDAIEQHMALTMKAGEVKTSMWQDMEHGRPTEIEAMNGYVAALGKELAIATPTNDLLASLVRAAEKARS